MDEKMKREIIIFTLIFITGLNNIFCGYSKALAENNSSQEATQVLQNEALYKKIIGGLMQENADLKATLANLRNFNTRLEKKAKDLYLKIQDNKQMRQDFAGLNNLLEKLNKEQSILKKENDNLQRRMGRLEEISRKEKADLTRALGTAYIKAKLFPQAIGAYLQALNLNPDNAELHYNLGLLYQHSEEDTKKSLYHFKKYLELEPQAKNKKEVEFLIAVLSESPSSF